MPHTTLVMPTDVRWLAVRLLQAGAKIEDGNLILGRILILVSDAFAENKIIAFITPEQGLIYVVTCPA